MRLRLLAEPGAFLFFMSYFSLGPLLQQLVYWRLCNINGCSKNNSGPMSNNSAGSCYRVTSAVQDKVESDTSHWIFYLNVAASVPAVLTSLLLGPLSDKMGRKPFLTLACSSVVVKVGWILVFWYYSLPLAFLFGGQVIAGFMGFDTGQSIFFAYVSDISSLEHRTTRIGVMEGMVYSGGAVGFLASNLWANGGNFGPPLWLTLGCGLMAVLYVTVFIQESIQLDVESSRPGCFHICRSAVCNVLRCCSVLHLQRCLVIGFSVYLILQIVFGGMGDIIVLYTLDWPLCWTSDLLAYYLASLMAGFAVPTLLLLPLLKKLAVSDFALIIAGLLSDTASMCVLGIARHNWLVFVGVVLSSPVALAFPSLRSMMTSMVPEDSYGLLFAVLSVENTVAMFLSSAIFNNLYPATRSLITPHGFCLFCIAGLLCLCAVLTAVMMKMKTQLSLDHPHLNVQEHTVSTEQEKNKETEPLLSDLSDTN